MELFLNCIFGKMAKMKKQLPVFMESEYSNCKKNWTSTLLNPNRKPIEISKNKRPEYFFKTCFLRSLLKYELIPNNPYQLFFKPAETFYPHKIS
jgi:hypothetical protein